MLTRFVAYIGGMLRRRRVAIEVDYEIRFHVDQETAANVARGMTPAEARRVALRDLGGLTQTTEAVRRVRMLGLTAVGVDLRQAIRRFRREPGFIATAVLILAIGIGSCAAMFSVVQAVLLRPIGVQRPDRVVMLWPKHDGIVGEMPFNMRRQMRERMQSFDEVAVVGSVNWSATMVLPGGEPVQTPYAAVSATFFDVLGARPLLGRTFQPEDDRPSAPRVLVLSHASWVSRFGADPNIAGRRLLIGEPFEIVGVMRAEFFLPRGAEYWTPAGPTLAGFARKRSEPIEPIFEGLGVFYGLARLKPDASMEEAHAEMGPFLKAAAAEQGIDLDLSLYTVAIVPLLEHVFGPARPALVVLMGAVVVVLLVACTNVGGLLLARGAARTREMAVRAALGASRPALVRQLLTESALLVIGGTVLGVGAAALSLDLLVALSPADIPRLDATTLDRGALLFAAVMAVLSTLVLGAIPAWRLSCPSFALDLKGSATGMADSSSRARSRSVLVGFQVTATLVLLTAAGLCVQSFARLTRLDLGFDPENVVTFNVRGLDGKRPDDVDRVLTQIGRTPGVTAIGGINQRPFENGPIGWDTSFLLEGQPDTQEAWSRNPMLNLQTVTPGYFQSMGIRLLAGRGFEATDSQTSPSVAIVSELMAGRVWPGLDPLGKRLYTNLLTDGEKPWRSLTVVGVVSTARYREIDNPRPDLYVPLRQSNIGVQHFMVRTDGDPTAVVPALRTGIAALESSLVMDGVTTMEQIVRRTRGPWQFNMFVFSLFGGVALALAVIGLFGLVTYSVSQRTREIGVRMALGARRGHVVGLMLWQGAGPVAVGLLLGLAAATLTTRLLSSLLFEVSPTDPATFAIVSGLLLMVTVPAIYLPARRAASVNPLVVLRDE